MRVGIHLLIVPLFGSRIFFLSLLLGQNSKAVGVRINIDSMAVHGLDQIFTLRINGHEHKLPVPS